MPVVSLYLSVLPKPSAISSKTLVTISACIRTRHAGTRAVHHGLFSMSSARFRDPLTNASVDLQYSVAFQEVTMLRVVLLVFSLCPAAFGQTWTHLGNLPTNPALLEISADGKASATSVQPFRRHWHKLVYLGGTAKKLMYWPANPNCCAGTFSNAIFLFDTTKALASGNVTAPGVWTLAWSRRTKANLGKAPITSILREKGTVKVSFSTDPLSVFYGGNVLITKTNSPSKHTFDGLYSITSPEDLLAHSLTYSQSPALPDEAGTCAGTGPNARCGFVVTPTDDLHNPSDRHPYWIIAYDSRRNVMYNGFGSSHASLAGCGDCSEQDFYKLDLNLEPSEWTQLCGDSRITIPCADIKGNAVP